VQGRPIAQEVINVAMRTFAKYRLEEHKSHRGAITQACARTGISRSTMYALLQDYMQTGELPSARENVKPRKGGFEGSLSQAHLEYVADLCDKTNKEKAGRVTIAFIQNALQIKFPEDGPFSDHRIRYSLKKHGFCFHRMRAGYAAAQSERVQALLEAYLLNLDELLEHNYLPVWTDESYAYTNSMYNYSWVSPKSVGEGDFMNGTPNSTGKRLIVIAAGTPDGELVGARLTWWADAAASADYHGNVGWDTYLRWFQEMFIPSLPTDRKCVIILDNASYHSCTSGPPGYEFPKVNGVSKTLSKLNKAELIDYLHCCNVEFDEDSYKAVLYQQAKELQESLAESKLRALLAGSGHTILFLPPYHPWLNPSEEIWGAAKNFIAHNRDPQKDDPFTKDETQALFIKGMDKANTEPVGENKKYKNMWAAAAAHSAAWADEARDKFEEKDPTF